MGNTIIVKKIEMLKFILGQCLVFTGAFTFACDICGSAANSFSMGWLPGSKQHFIGLRTNMRTFESTPLHESQQKSKEFFSATDLFGRYNISRKCQLLAFVPYVYNLRKDSSETISVSGIGDVTLIGNYLFIQTPDSLEKKVKHTASIGMGLKAPTGNYFKLGFTELNMLPGTGSWDFIANLNYSMQFKNFGIQHESGFTFKTANRYAYRFGNAISVSQMIFYKYAINAQTKLIPQLGFSWFHNQKDQKNGTVSEDTFNGGSIVNIQFGLLFLVKNWAFSGQTFLPIAQQLNDGYVKQKNAIRLSITYFISKK